MTGAQNCGGWRNAWFDSGYMICISSRVAFGRIPGFLRDGADSAPEVDSRLLFSEVAAHIVDNGSGMYCTGFAVMDAPRVVLPTIALSMHCRCFGLRAVFPRKSGQKIHEPLVSGRLLQQSGRCAGGFFWQPSTMLLPGDLPPMS